MQFQRVDIRALRSISHFGLKWADGRNAAMIRRELLDDTITARRKRTKTIGRGRMMIGCRTDPRGKRLCSHGRGDPFGRLRHARHLVE